MKSPGCDNVEVRSVMQRARGGLSSRLREIGLVLIFCAPNGEIVERDEPVSDEAGGEIELRRGRDGANDGKGVEGADVVDGMSGGESGVVKDRGELAAEMLSKLLCQSALFHGVLKRVVLKWESQDEPVVVEGFPGVWLSGMPVLNRRRRVGYGVLVIATEEFLESEQLSAMCQSARQDFELTRRTLRELGLTAREDVSKLAAMARWAHEDSLRAAADTQAIESVGKQLAESYEEMNLLYTITQNMTIQERPERFIAVACKELLTTLPYAWIGLQLAENRQRLKSMAGRLIIAGESGQPASIVRSIAKMLLNNAHPDTPMVLEPHRNPKHTAFAALGKTVLVQPLSDQHEVLGLLLAGDKRPDEAGDITASNIDIKLLGAAAAHMTIFLENAALYDDLNAMFIGTLEALTASIDAKDRYTCGHSRRVAHLTQQLARSIGMDDHSVSRCHIAGLIHDVGKIGVPEAVLLKPGKLTAEEFAWIRKHPEMGHRILKDIPQLEDVLPGVLHHHERWDGRGYPDGLRGEAIPLMARLISLADSFDAMSSTRTYRSAMSRSQVLHEIEKCAGLQFDPALAHQFLTLDFSEYDRMTAEFASTDLGSSFVKEKAA